MLDYLNEIASHGLYFSTHIAVFGKYNDMIKFFEGNDVWIIELFDFRAERHKKQTLDELNLNKRSSIEEVLQSIAYVKLTSKPIVFYQVTDVSFSTIPEREFLEKVLECTL